MSGISIGKPKAPKAAATKKKKSTKKTTKSGKPKAIRSDATLPTIVVARCTKALGKGLAKCIKRIGQLRSSVPEGAWIDEELRAVQLKLIETFLDGHKVLNSEQQQELLGGVYDTLPKPEELNDIKRNKGVA